jgi:hypothetical protein
MKLNPYSDGERKALDLYIRKMEHHRMLVPDVLDEQESEKSPEL